MTIKEELLELTQQLSRYFTIPAVRRVFIPEPDPGPDKNTEFGILALEDGSAGLYYAWLGASQQGMSTRFPALDIGSKDTMMLAGYFASADAAECSIGMAVINAITQSTFARAGYVPAPAGDSLGSLDIRPGDHVGMVGYFPSLVRQLRERGMRVTVIEKKEKFLGTDGTVTVVNDPGQLRECNKVLSTAATLLNNSIDTILEYVADAEAVVVIGPTAGFFPDPLFARGVTAVGGTQILNADVAIERQRGNEKMGDSARKYLIRREEYPGIERLLEIIGRRSSVSS